jgi:transposase
VITPSTADLARLDGMPGVNRRTAEVIIAEIGVDMRQFPTAKHLASGARLCPGQHESADKRKAGTTRKGNRWLRTALVEAALSASRASRSGLAARYRRVMRHRGHKKAVIPLPRDARQRVSRAGPPRAVP